jgi:adenosylcobinamide-GDP ribazoletransferase
MKRLKQALIFLTVLPLRYSGEFLPGDLGRAAGWFPLVGLLIGGFLAGAYFILSYILPPLVVAVLVTALWALLTGGLHLDGLADCGDGLLASLPAERRLEIMKDPRMGSFGGLALGLQLLMKVSLLAGLAAGPGRSPGRLALLALLFAPVLARWLIMLVGRQPMARPGGLGVEFQLGLSTGQILAAAVLPIIFLFLAGPRGLLAVLLAHLAALGGVRLAKNRLGGVTGDVIGLVVELGESAALLAFVARLPFGY